MSSSQSTVSGSNLLITSGVLDPSIELTEIRLDDGRTLRLPTALLQKELQPEAQANESLEAEAVVVPAVEEHLQLGKRVVSTGTVRLSKTVQSYETLLDEPLAIRTFDVERTVLNQHVEVAPSIRQEGDTTVYPVVEEQAVVTKILVLKEEIRVTRRDTIRRDQQAVTLRREHVEVEREAL